VLASLVQNDDRSRPASRNDASCHVGRIAPYGIQAADAPTDQPHLSLVEERMDGGVLHPDRRTEPMRTSSDERLERVAAPIDFIGNIG